MNRIEISNSASPHFIGSWNILNDELCKNIISFFEKNPSLQKQGVTAGNSFDENVKKSTDITIYPNNLKSKEYEIFVSYFKHLNECFLDYKEQFPFLKTFLKKLVLVLSTYKNIALEIIFQNYTLNEQI